MIFEDNNYPVVYGSINIDTLRVKSVLSVRNKSHSDFANSTLQGMLNEEHVTWRWVPLTEILWFWGSGLISTEEIRSTIREHIKSKYNGRIDQFINIDRDIERYKNKQS